MIRNALAFRPCSASTNTETRSRRASAYTIRVKNGQYVSVSASMAFSRLGDRSCARASARMSCGTARKTSVTRMMASEMTPR